MGLIVVLNCPSAVSAIPSFSQIRVMSIAVGFSTQALKNWSSAVTESLLNSSTRSSDPIEFTPYCSRNLTIIPTADEPVNLAGVNRGFKISLSSPLGTGCDVERRAAGIWPFGLEEVGEVVELSSADGLIEYTGVCCWRCCCW